jgi:hypothetical protein
MLMNNYPPAKPLTYWQKISPVAKGMRDAATPGQLAAIRTIANSQRIIFEDACKVLFDCKAEDLSRQAASTYIDWLKAQQRRQHVNDAMNFCPECKGLLAQDWQAPKWLKCPEGHRYEVASVEAA